MECSLALLTVIGPPHMRVHVCIRIMSIDCGLLYIWPDCACLCGGFRERRLNANPRRYLVVAVQWYVYHQRGQDRGGRQGANIYHTLVIACIVLFRWRRRREDLNQESRHSSWQRVAKEEAPADINPWILGRSSTIAKVVPAINKFNMCSVSRGGGVHTFRSSSLSGTWTNVGFRRHKPSDEAAIQLIKAVCKPWVVNDMAIYLFRHCCKRRIITRRRDWWCCFFVLLAISGYPLFEATNDGERSPEYNI